MFNNEKTSLMEHMCISINNIHLFQICIECYDPSGKFLHLKSKLVSSASKFYKYFPMHM